MAEGVEIIIVSDDDDDTDCENDLSCLIVEVEDVKKTGNKQASDSVLPPSSLDEDLIVTFSRHAEVLPHARYDCPIHPFTATDSENAVPVDSNQLMCDQCFCYICDKLASLCVMWCHSGVCHCNGHKRSNFWNSLRNYTVLGGLGHFHFRQSEIDSHIRRAETLLQSFRQELCALYSFYLNGKTLLECGQTQLDQQSRIYDYTPVYECVSSFLNKADKENSRAAAVMNLGAAKEFITHFCAPGTTVQTPLANSAEAKIVLLQRVIASLQRQMVMADFTSKFIFRLQDFYQNLNFPAELESLRNSLCVRGWDDLLLVSVLRGQNVSGTRKDKGKKDILIEQISVVLLRIEHLQRLRRYRELYRYLRVVQIDDARLLQQVQDLIPFSLCMDGDFTEALTSLFSLVDTPASRFTPYCFLCYLRIFQTATAPKLTFSQPTQFYFSDAEWESIKGAEPLKRAKLVRFALRAQRCSSAVYTDSQCWASLLTIANTQHPLPAPSPQFLHDSWDVVKSILHSQQGSSIQIPRSFQEVYPDQALLLLVTGALALRILNAPLSPALPVLTTFKENMWAFRWLWDSLSSSSERVESFFKEVTQEAENSTAWPHCTSKLLEEVLKQ